MASPHGGCKVAEELHLERGEEKYLAGCCGLFCGLCPRFQSQAPSRCPGCQLGEHHSYCSIYRCCVTKRAHFTCAGCNDYPCERLQRVLGVEGCLDSFISHRPALPNLERIRKVGLNAFLDEQRERRLLAEELIAGFNEGRSMTFYCTACILMPPVSIRRAILEVRGALVMETTPDDDLKGRAKSLRYAIEKLAQEAGIDLKLRRKR